MGRKKIKNTMCKNPIIEISVKWFDSEGTENEMNAECLTWESAVEELGKLEIAYERGVVEAERKAKDALED